MYISRRGGISMVRMLVSEHCTPSSNIFPPRPPLTDDKYATPLRNLAQRTNVPLVYNILYLALALLYFLDLHQCTNTRHTM